MHATVCRNPGPTPPIDRRKEKKRYASLRRRQLEYAGLREDEITALIEQELQDQDEKEAAAVLEPSEAEAEDLAAEDVAAHAQMLRNVLGQDADNEQEMAQVEEEVQETVAERAKRMRKEKRKKQQEKRKKEQEKTRAARLQRAAMSARGRRRKP